MTAAATKGDVRSVSHTPSHLTLKTNLWAGGFIGPILWMRKLRHRVMK